VGDTRFNANPCDDYVLKKLTLDIRPEVHKRLRLLSVVTERSISSLVSEAIEKMLEEHQSIIPTINIDNT